MKQISAIEYITAIVIGFLIGLRVFGATLGLFYMAAGGACIYLAFRNDHYKLFTILPYIVYTEIFIRNGAGVTYVPYLFLEYLMIGIFLIMLANKGGALTIHSRCILPIFFYTIIEALDMIRAEDIEYARSMLTNSVLLTSVALWGSANTFTPKLTAQVIKHLTLASVYICGNILVAHFTHDITYSSVSSSEATNSMAPVQISAFLGVGTSLLFLYIMQEKSKQHFFMHMIVFTISVTLMVLTFSRGGIYFLAGVMILYSLLNWKELHRFGIMLLFIPVGYVVYYYSFNATDGLIENRYVEKGNSGRSELVEAGFQLFLQQPLVGVGTGNYGKEVSDRGLYSAESGAHNEFIRAAAEHGILGIAFYWSFYIIIFFEILNRKKKQRDFGLYLFLLFVLIIVHNGLKIGIQFYVLTLILATPSFARVSAKKQHAKLTHYITRTT